MTEAAGASPGGTWLRDLILGGQDGRPMTLVGLPASFVSRHLAGRLPGASGSRRLRDEGRVEPRRPRTGRPPPAADYLRYPQLWSLSESSAQRSPMSSR